MKVATLEESKKVARVKYAEYMKAVKERHSEEYEALKNGYRELFVPTLGITRPGDKTLISEDDRKPGSACMPLLSRLQFEKLSERCVVYG